MSVAENRPGRHALGLPGLSAGRIVFLTRVCVTSGAPGLRRRGQALAIAEVAAAANVIESVVGEVTTTRLSKAGSA